jgi:Tol biopolymer transport system component
MTPERWQQVKELFQSALKHAPSQRTAFLDQACAGDEELRKEVESLIASHEKTGSFIDAPAIAAAAQLLAEGKPELTPGQRIGHYKILSLLGAGGMGEVYLAQDTKLGRDIALKLLPAQFITDGNRLRRFEQEARTASALNHPNVCVIHEVGDTAEGRNYIAMEYVDGETLRQVMTGRRMGLDEVFEVAVQVASGLAAAHKVGIVHRDIKPENVMIRRDGYVKVLDFGLAKLTEQDATDVGAPAPPRVKTDTGVVMGTSSYMSPEQARALTVDARTDIWSLGVVLYEMVTGRPPFEGATTSDVIVSILEREPPPLARLSPKAPAELQRIITKALQKDREARYPAVKDTLHDLKTLKQELELEAKLGQSLQSGSSDTGMVAAKAVGPAIHPRSRWRTNHLIGWAVVLTIAIVSGVWFYPSRTSKDSASSGPESLLPPMKVVPFTSFPGKETWPAVSPDGKQIAFIWNGATGDNFDVYVKLVGAGEPLRLTTHPGKETSPAWSPDGKHIAFTRSYQGQNAIYTISALGGSERQLLQLVLESGSHGRDPMVVWSADGRSLAFPDRSSPDENPSIFLLSVDSLEKRRLTTAPAQYFGDWFPAFSPDGKTLAFIRWSSGPTGDIYLVSVDGGEPRRLTFEDAWISGLDWTPEGGSIVFAASRGGRLRLWRISVSGGTPEPLKGVDDVSRSPWGYSPPSISRHGHQLAYVQSLDDSNIWRIEVPNSKVRGNPPTKLISSTMLDQGAQYSPDGKRIVFESTRSGFYEIWVCDSDGTNTIQLTTLDRVTGTPRWSPDGRQIAFDCRQESHSDIYVINVEGGSPRRLTTEASDDNVPSWSRDGRWIYFASNRSGTRQVWKMPAEGGQAVQVTKQGGFAAFESPDGKFVYYAKFDSPGLWRVGVESGEEALVLDQPKAGYWDYWAVVDAGIYFVNAEVVSRPTIEFYSFATRRVRQIAAMEKEAYKWSPGFAISPDGRSILCTSMDQSGSDIMLAENFR